MRLSKTIQQIQKQDVGDIEVSFKDIHQIFKMSQIKEILYFYSRFSNRSKSVTNYIQRSQVPVTPICVDTKDVRRAIRKINVTGVPTIMVVYEDEEMEKYDGPKVIQFLEMLISSKRNQEVYTPNGGPHVESGEYDEYPSGDEMPSAEYPEGGEDDDGLEIIGEITPPKHRNIKDQQMSTIKSIAKQMEEERKAMLGFDDEGNLMNKQY